MSFFPPSSRIRTDDAAHSVNELVERGREATARGAWRQAYNLLVAADSAELSAEDLELIGEATSWTGPTEHCIQPTIGRAAPTWPAGPEKCRAALALVRDQSLARASYRTSADSKLSAMADQRVTAVGAKTGWRLTP